MLAMLEALAKVHSDGHYTICKFTTNYRVMLNTPDNLRDEINNSEAGVGVTLDLAIMDLIMKKGRS